MILKNIATKQARTWSKSKYDSMQESRQTSVQVDSYLEFDMAHFTRLQSSLASSTPKHTFLINLQVNLACVASQIVTAVGRNHQCLVQLASNKISQTPTTYPFIFCFRFYFITQSTVYCSRQPSNNSPAGGQRDRVCGRRKIGDQ